MTGPIRVGRVTGAAEHPDARDPLLNTVALALEGFGVPPGLPDEVVNRLDHRLVLDVQCRVHTGSPIGQNDRSARRYRIRMLENAAGFG